LSGIHIHLQIQWPGFSLDAAFDAPGRGITALFGPSGCGKTTLLRSIAGLEPTAKGHVRINDVVWQNDQQSLPAHEREIGYVFQEASLFPHLSVLGNLQFGRKRSRAKAQIDLDALVELLGIAPLLNRQPQSLSGGERQRVGIARALAVNPHLLLMDEPLAALDVARKQEIIPYLERLHRELKLPVLYVTHSPDEVVRLAHHIVALEAGKVVSCGSLVDTLSRVDLPIRLGDDLGAVLQATVGEIDTQWKLARLDFAGGFFWTRAQSLSVGDSVRVRVLARDVSIACERPATSTIQNILQARITDIVDDDQEGLALVRVMVGDSALIARVTLRSVAELKLEPQLPVWIQVKSVALT
jgi:molybdate transport system ATP-binding protein